MATTVTTFDVSEVEAMLRERFGKGVTFTSTLTGTVSIEGGVVEQPKRKVAKRKAVKVAKKAVAKRGRPAGRKVKVGKGGLTANGKRLGRPAGKKAVETVTAPVAVVEADEPIPAVRIGIPDEEFPLTTSNEPNDNILIPA